MEIQGPKLLDPGLTIGEPQAKSLKEAVAESSQDRTALTKAAQEFEGVFLNTLMKAMRATVPESKLFNGGGATKFYRQMQDAEIAKGLAGTGSGMGVAEMIVRQLDQKTGENEGPTVQPQHPPIGPQAPGAAARYRDLEPVSPNRVKMVRTRMLASTQEPAVADTLRRFEFDLDHVSASNDLDPALVLAVVMEESGGDPLAQSPKGALGLMQLMPGTAAELGVADPRDPSQNLAGGARYLAQMLTRFDGRLDLALAAYNAGPGHVQAAGRRIPNFPETQRYVSRVLDRYRRLGGGTDLATDK